MAVEVFMPKAGMDMKEGKIISWLKNVGDKVEEGEGLLSIETDKVTMEVESPAAGTLLRRYFEDGATVPVVTIIGYVGNPGEKVPETPTQAGGEVKSADNAAVGAAPVKAEPVSALASASGSAEKKGYVPATAYAKSLAKEHGISLNTVTPTGTTGEVKARDIEAKLLEEKKESKVGATPLAQRIAADKGIDIGTVSGSGYMGKVKKDDLPGSAPAPAATAVSAGFRREKISGIRKVVAERMLKAHTELPCVTLNMTADVTELLALREKINEKREKEDRVSINDFVLKAVAKALSMHGEILVSLEDGELVYKEGIINLGMAVAVDNGLIVPVIKGADTLSLDGISKSAKALAKKAREGKLSMDEYKGSTFTVTNLGMFGVESFSPIINQPDSCILGVCAVKDELALISGQVVVRKKLGLSLTHDHRVIDGAPAAIFTKAVKDLLEDPISVIL